MARFMSTVPKENIAEIKKMERNLEKIFGEMTKAGAEVAMNEVKANAPENLKSHVKVSKTYKTPSDGGINNKVYFSGYLPFNAPNRTTFVRRGRGGGKVYSTTKGVPADFIAILYEYGRSTAPFPKKPFFRRSFNEGKIEKAMMQAQKEASGGLLDE